MTKHLQQEPVAAIRGEANSEVINQDRRRLLSIAAVDVAAAAAASVFPAYIRRRRRPEARFAALVEPASGFRETSRKTRQSRG